MTEQLTASSIGEWLTGLECPSCHHLAIYHEQIGTGGCACNIKGAACNCQRRLMGLLVQGLEPFIKTHTKYVWDEIMRLRRRVVDEKDRADNLKDEYAAYRLNTVSIGVERDLFWSRLQEVKALRDRLASAGGFIDVVAVLDGILSNIKVEESVGG